MISAAPDEIQAVRGELRCGWSEAQEVVERREVQRRIDKMYASNVDQNVIDVLEWLVSRV
jgi:hypothetical protein